MKKNNYAMLHANCYYSVKCYFGCLMHLIQQRKTNPLKMQFSSQRFCNTVTCILKIVQIFIYEKTFYYITIKII